MASSVSSSRKITLKLLIDKTNEKVVFAEAGKDFIDLLFHLMLLPIGKLTSFLKEKGMAGSLLMLHNSIENFSDAYTQPGFNKDSLLKPRPPPLNPDSSPLLLNDTTDSSASKNYIVFGSLPSHHGAKCPTCGNDVTSASSLFGPSDSALKKPTSREGDFFWAKSREGDYVKELVTYMVMDDLMVKPISTISCIALLSAFNIKDVGALEEKVVKFGKSEGIKLLKASLQSKTVLTDVFLSNK